jgi:1-acyl-sn-glycerol-3-phosphate acyltransferase
VFAARWRLVWLWFSQTARSLADACLAVFIVLQLSRLGIEQGSAAWLTTLALLLAPFLVLAPVNGTLSNSLPKQAVLAGSAVFCFCRTAFYGVAVGGPFDPWVGWLSLGLIGIGHAVYRAARYALLNAAAQEAQVPLSRVIGWMETGSVMGGIAGIFTAYSLQRVSWAEILTTLQGQSSLVSTVLRHFPFVVAVSLGFELVAVVAAFAVQFPSDVRRAEPAMKAVAGFFRDSRGILKDREARGSVLGLACFMGLIAAGFLASLTLRVGVERLLTRSDNETGLEQALLLLGLGTAAGCLSAGLQVQSHRVLGLVPPAALGLTAALVCAAAGIHGAWVYALFGLVVGLMMVPWRTAFSVVLPAMARGNGMALMNGANALSLGMAALAVFGLARLGILMPPGQLWLFAALAALGALIAWRLLLRDTFEQLGEMLLWPMYRIRVRGPGIRQIPPHGPLLVLANHTAWFDPLWLAKILPRRVTPLMTSRFFDLPILHWLMRDVAGAIRVEEVAYRREAPELEEAVAVLERGGCLLLFPEGALQRRPEQALRRFGQGVWRILRQRPETPVVVCWIEGGWGSFTSYYGGPPTVNKHLDWQRPIEIAIESPEVIDPAILADQQAAREYLMRACLRTRRYLGLDPLPLSSETARQPG